MAFSVSPSVIVREVDATAVVPAVATPPAAIAGVFHWGPVNERILITSETELTRRFGSPSDFNAETFFTAADYLAYSNNLYVTRVDNGANTASSTHFEAKYPGALGNGIEVSYITPSTYQSTIVSAGEVEGAITFNSSSMVLESSEDYAFEDAVEDDIIRVGNDSIGYQDMIVSSVTETSSTDANTGITDYEYTLNFKNNFTLPEIDASTLNFTKYWGKTNLVSGSPTDGTMHIVVTDKSGNISGVAGSVLEIYENISDSPTARVDDGSSNYYVNVLENRSNWVRASSTLININNVTTSDNKYEELSGGSDGSNESSVSLGAVARGYDLYKNANEVDVSFILQGKANVALDGSGIPTSADLANYIISNIVDERKDCVLFISPPKESTVEVSNDNTRISSILGYRNSIQTSSYWFMDTGYKYRYDKYNDVYRWVPMNGDMAGLASRIEPWESPAGYKRGVIKNVVKLAFNPNKSQRDVLYGSNINPVISQVGQGVVLFGDKTGLGQPSAFDRINVRRLFISVEKVIATAAQSFLFDFNDEFTQTQFRNVIEPFLRDIQGRRGIIDFRIVSDETVNTPEVIDQNKFRANIFIKPARSINVIELTFVATRTGVEFDEIVGAIA